MVGEYIGGGMKSHFSRREMLGAVYIHLCDEVGLFP